MRDDDDGTPIPEPTATPTATETLAPTATPSPTATPDATSFLDQVADDEALFCAADPVPAEGVGFYRGETCESGDGFR